MALVSGFVLFHVFVCLHTISVSCTVGCYSIYLFARSNTSLQTPSLPAAGQASFLLAVQRSGLSDQRSTQRDVVPCRDQQGNCSSRAKPGCIDPPRPPCCFSSASKHIGGNVCTGVSDVQSDLELPPVEPGEEAIMTADI